MDDTTIDAMINPTNIPIQEEPIPEIPKINVFAIDENGFLLWEFFRLENEGYEPGPLEVLAIPPNNLSQPLWNGLSWEEGKDHPKAPKQTELPDFFNPPPQPEGTHWELEGKTLPGKIAYLSNLEITEANSEYNKENVLLAMIQDLQRDVSELRKLVKNGI